MRRRSFLPALIVTVAATLGQAEEPTPHPTPDSGLVERVGRELVQLEVRADGPSELLDALGPDDLELLVDGHLIERFLVDRTCAGKAATASVTAGGVVPTLSAAPTYRTSYLFYFDQHHLRVDGRQRAIELARSLVPELLRDGARIRIVSAGPRARALDDWTDDPAALLAALDQIERDPAQFDTYASEEDRRVAEVIQAYESHRDLADGVNLWLVAQKRSNASYAAFFQGLGLPADMGGRSLDAKIAANEKMEHESALLVARAYQRDEAAQATTALERFAVTLGLFGPVAPPKAVVYFADTVRANPGDHYVELFPGGFNPIREGRLPAFQELIEEATRQGVRLYTVQAAGLTSELSPILGTRAVRYASGPLAASQRFADAKAALGGLAAETGGRTFLHGASADTIAAELHDDLACQFVLSFPPGDLPRDRPLPVRVVARVPHLRVSSRPSLVVRGVSAIRRERIAEAFLAPDASDGGGPSIAVIPTDIRKGGYTALVQVALPPTAAPGTWDIGLSLVGGLEVREEGSGRVSLDRPGVPLVYEAELEFSAGPFELVAVAEDLAGERVVSARTTGSWPERDRATGFGPLIAIQRSDGAFVRGDAVRQHGSRSMDEREPIDPSRPLALIGVACGAGEFSVERRLTGETVTGFLEIRPEANERCVLFRDVVPAGTLGSGNFLYEAVIRNGDGTMLATTERRLAVP